MRTLEEVNGEIARIEEAIDARYDEIQVLRSRKRALLEEATEIMIASPTRRPREVLSFRIEL